MNSIVAASKNPMIVKSIAAKFINSRACFSSIFFNGRFILNNAETRSRKQKKVIAPVTGHLAGFARNFTLEPSQILSYEDFSKLVESGSLQLFDVRQPEECQSTGLIPGAVNIPIGQLGQAFLSTPGEFQEKYKVKMPKKTDVNVAFYCLGGVRSAGALAMAQTIGFQNCRHFAGGWAEWARRQNEK